MTEIKPSPALAEARLIVPFINAVKQVFTQMVGVEVVVLKPRIKDRENASHDICGIIGFSGTITGSVIISFSTAAAVKLVESFASIKADIHHADFADAIGELANMIAGTAKRHLAEGASISIPTVIIGSGYTVAGMSNTPAIIIPCSSPCGDFTVEICIKNHEANHNK